MFSSIRNNVLTGLFACLFFVFGNAVANKINQRMELIRAAPEYVRNDNYPEIFFGDNNGYVHGIDYNGNPINGFPVQLEGTSNEIWGSPAIADIDNDNEIEIVVVSKNNHAYIIDENGNIELDYETDEYLMGSPSLANLDKFFVII